MSHYIKAISSFNVYNFTLGPYKEGYRNIKKTFGTCPSFEKVNNTKSQISDHKQKGTPSLAHRVKHLILGITLFVPLVNVVVLFASNFLMRKNNENSNKSSSNNQKPHTDELNPSALEPNKTKQNKKKKVAFKEERIREFYKNESPEEVKNQNSIVIPLISNSVQSERKTDTKKDKA